MSDETNDTPVIDNDVAGHGLHTGAERLRDIDTGTQRLRDVETGAQRLRDVETGTAPDDVEGHDWNRIRNPASAFEAPDDGDVEGHRLRSKSQAADDDEDVEGHRLH